MLEFLVKDVKLNELYILTGCLHMNSKIQFLKTLDAWIEFFDLTPNSVNDSESRACGFFRQPEEKDLKTLVRSLLPPILLDFTRSFRRKISINIFGLRPHYSATVYTEFPNLETGQEDVWESKNWIGHVKNSILQNNLNELSIHKIAVVNSCRILSGLTDCQKIHVVDFGGGNGMLVDPLLGQLSDINIEVQMSIIDSPQNVELGRITFSDKKNVNFYDYSNTNITDIVKKYDAEGYATILNMSSVLQYIPNYREFLTFLVEKATPILVCITRFPRCDNATSDAYAIQNVTTPLGFCGRTVVNLFAKNSLRDHMKLLGYSLVVEERNQSQINYFDKCSDKKYRKMTMLACTFIRDRI